MKKVSKAILIGLGVVVALVIALLVGLNLYIQSPGAQARIQEELSKALRLPLKITNTSVTPWSDLRITGISIPNGDTNFLEATSFSARYRLIPLLEGKLIISEMRVEKPKVIWVQNAEGKWALPEPEEAAAVSKESKEKSKVAASPEAIPGAETPQGEKPAKEKTPKLTKAEKGQAEKKNFDVVIDRFEVKDGEFELFDKDKRRVASFSGVTMIYTKLTADQLEGTATIARASWTDGYTLENVTAPFSYTNANREIWLPQINATLAGGNLRGNYRSHVETKHTPFACKLEFDGIKLDPLVTQGGGKAGEASGELHGKLDMHGDTDRMEKAEGAGSLDLRDGRFSQFELFQTIGRILDIKELADFHINEGQAEFRVAGDKIYVDRIALEAPSLGITAKGTVRLDKNEKNDKGDKPDKGDKTEKGEKKIALEAQLSVDDAIVARLPGKVPEAFASNGQGRRTIDFTVGGTLDKPKTNLGDKLIAQTINAQFGGLLNSIFDDKKEEDMQRKREEEKRKKEEDDRKKAEKADKKDKKKKDKDKATPSPDAAPAPAPVPDATPSPAPAPKP